MGSLRLAAHCFGYLKNSSFSEKEEKCPLNPTTKKRRRLRPLVNLLRRPNSRKMLEKPLQERRRKCKPREPLIRKRKRANLSVNDNLVKWIRARNNSNMTSIFSTPKFFKMCQLLEQNCKIKFVRIKLEKK